MSNDKLHNRLRRVQGQLKKIQENIDGGCDCLEVATQFLAVKGAVAAAFEEYIKESLGTCAKSDEDKLEQLIALLVKS